MAVLEDLTEEEAALFALLSDPSGLDQAEFLHHSWESSDGVWRAHPYQWRWFRDDAPLMLDQCARAVGKTTSIMVRMTAFMLLYPGHEAVITAPQMNHLSPIIKLVKDTVLESRFLKSFLPKGRTTGITHTPFFTMAFVNGARIVGKIPHEDGAGMKGVHPTVLEMDEAQNYPDPGWTEIIETLRRGVEGARWRVHGVTRGMRDFFWKLSEPGSGWKVNRIVAMQRPDWTDQERQEKIELYGSKESPDYRRNILGLHGSENSPMFVLTRLMQCVDVDPTSEYNSKEYYLKKVDDETYSSHYGTADQLLQLPSSHLKEGRLFIAGMDVGITQHPSEILVFAQERPGDGGPFTLRLMTRVQLKRVSYPAQVEIIRALMKHYSLRIFSLDKTGIGLPLYQQLQETSPEWAQVVRGYNFSEKILVHMDEAVRVDPYLDNAIEKAGIYRNVLEHSSDMLRLLVDQKRLQLPFDRELIGEFQGQTYVIIKDHTNPSGKKQFNRGHFHALDACKMAALAVTQEPIETFVRTEAQKDPKEGPVYAQFIFG